MGGNFQEKVEVFNIDNVCAGMRVSQEIKDKNGSLLFGTGSPLTDKAIQKLKLFGITNVPIFVTSIVDNSGINVSEIFREQLIDNVKLSVAKYVKNENYANRIISAITDFSKDDLFMSLLAEIKIIGHDILLHSINVFTLSMMVALKYHFPADRLLITAQASLLHDIGKKFLPREILDKEPNLNSEEQISYEQHPLFGFEYIKTFDMYPNELAKIILQHHERLDGSGYPEKLSGDSIHKISQIICIADTFDNILGRQESKNRFIISDAIQYLNSTLETYFNADYVRCIVEEITVYHLYDWVVLNNDDIGIITRLNDAMQLRPVVTVLYDRFKQKYPVPKNIDLSQKENSSILIRAIID